MNSRTLPLVAGLCALLAGPAVLATAPEELIRHNCAGCHTDAQNPAGPLTRMQEQRKTPEGWKIFDIAVEGVSLVLTYRAEFESITRTSGVDGLIKRLQEKNA